ncbi:substrate-binding domain-containing protein [Cellulomonas marina]|uniref:DNA-binding transcriptional regulator, LacI/PurR family n=1 Tax=Cellulomonas marina TaxID=988821 RepID=A0A1I1AK81_9CELL|nr:substrate-binding domain-containing protein [Cellulomonas marina]GIG30166.1 LacI family transcriptional regulator [Cellulomonas marina]SFB38419.1 DNA-binding transcriptional regulator, LacI/PurR family [Cellulomonas marina]
MSVTDTRRVLPVTRRAQLLEALATRGTVRIADLVDELGVTAITLRRDIGQLAAEGLVQRVHGGATLLPGVLPTPTTTGAAPTGSSPAGTSPDHAPDASAPGDVDTATPATPTGALGMLVPSLDYYWPGVVRGAEEEARSRGLRIVLRGSSYAGDDESPQLERLATQPGVRGLLVAPTLDGPGAAATLDWLARSPVPVVLLERSAALGPHHEAAESVVSDHRLGAAMAVRHLAGLGHRRVLVAASRTSPTTRHVLAGWREACEDLGLPCDDDLALPLPPHEAPGWEDAVDALVDRCAGGGGATGLLVHSDPEAIALVQRCEQRGLSVPGDLSVVAYDDEVAGLFSPALTAVRPPRRSVGRAAVALLAARLADPGRPVHRVLVSPSLRVRASTAPPAL